MSDEEKVEIYTIPPNFAEEGTMLSGRIKTRNAVELAVLSIIFFLVIFAVEVSIRTKIYIAIIVMLPVSVIAVLGIQGESLFAFIGGILRFAKRRRAYYPAEAGEGNEPKSNRKKGGQRWRAFH